MIFRTWIWTQIVGIGGKYANLSDTTTLCLFFFFYVFLLSPHSGNFRFAGKLKKNVGNYFHLFGTGLRAVFAKINSERWRNEKCCNARLFFFFPPLIKPSKGPFIWFYFLGCLCRPKNRSVGQFDKKLV